MNALIIKLMKLRSGAGPGFGAAGLWFWTGSLLCLAGFCQFSNLLAANISVQPKVTLASLIESNRDSAGVLPPRDADDPQPLPAWLRVYLRRNLSGLPVAGRPQYPRQSVIFLKWLEDKQTFTSAELSDQLRLVKKAIPETVRENQQRAKYAPEWEVAVPEGTKLDAVRRSCDERFDLLPSRDLEDQSPLPIWFRVYLRQQFPKLSKFGTYQYPRTSNRSLQQLLDNPNSSELEQYLNRSAVRSGRAGARPKPLKQQKLRN